MRALQLLAIALVVSCTAEPNQGAARAVRYEAPAADLIIIAERVHGLDDTIPPGEAVAIAGGRILAVSTRDAVLRYRGGQTHIIEFEGAHVFPGLADAHARLAGRRVRSETEDLERRLLDAQAACLRAGLTSVHDFGVTAASRRTLRRLEAAGTWKLGVYGVVAGPESGGSVPPLDDPGPRSRLRFRALDLRVSAPERSVLAARLVQCAVAGYQPCLGGKSASANRLALDLIASVLDEPTRSRLRPRLEDAGFVARRDLLRLVRLGVIARIQPALQGSGTGTFATKDLIDAHTAVCFGSNFPGRSESPWDGIRAAVTMRSEQAIGRREALRAATAGVAYAAFEEGVRGRIAPGFEADLTIVDRDLEAVPDAALLGTRVLATVIGGTVAYRLADRGGDSR